MISTLFTSTVTLFAYAQEDDEDTSLPRLKDSSLRVELVADGLRYPTSMDFIDKDGNMIILQKDEGEAVLVSTNGDASQNNDPPVVASVSVNIESERGFLGIAVADSNSGNNGKAFVFLYFTEPHEGSSEIRNRVYRYEWDADQKILTRSVLILDLPGEPGPNHDGGKLIVGKGGNTSLQSSQEDYLYTVVGDLNRNGLLQNFKNGTVPDDTSVVYRLTLDGSAPADNPFFDSNASSESNGFNKYFAYGIRNSFGLAIDPVTGILWMTENGPESNDEINVVKPGFNSGWEQVMGPMEENDVNTDDLVQLEGSHYADPVLSWSEPVGITDIEFLDSTKLGTKYANNIFVGDINEGNLYFLTVNETRTGITLEDGSGGDVETGEGLRNPVIDNSDQLAAITLGTDFKGGITDIETGPDGYLYVLSFDGMLYRIVPNSQ